MKNSITVTKSFKESDEQDRKYWRNKTPEERLDMVEILRLQSGKFLYEYPARIEKIIEVIRKNQKEVPINFEK